VLVGEEKRSIPNRSVLLVVETVVLLADGNGLKFRRWPLLVFPECGRARGLATDQSFGGRDTKKNNLPDY